MKSREWKTYRTRFLVKAKQLNCSLSFVDPLGRQHSGRKGDYLVESSDGVISIAPRQIFEDIYVPMMLEDENATLLRRDPAQPRMHNDLRPPEPVAVGRKLPQGCRDRRGSNSTFGFM
jgi:hypothetical protein